MANHVGVHVVQVSSENKDEFDTAMMELEISAIEVSHEHDEVFVRPLNYTWTDEAKGEGDEEVR